MNEHEKKIDTGDVICDAYVLVECLYFELRSVNETALSHANARSLQLAKVQVAPKSKQTTRSHH